MMKPAKKPVYKQFMGGRYKLYAAADSLEGAQIFVKKHADKFKGLKVTAYPNHPGDWLVWEEV